MLGATVKKQRRAAKWGSYLAARSNTGFVWGSKTKTRGPHMNGC